MNTSTHTRRRIAATFATLATGLSISLASAPASAAVITFDDIDINHYCPPTANIANGYHGFDWDNFGALDTENYNRQRSGYRNGVTSGTQVGFSRYAKPATVSSTSTFDFNQAQLTGAWNNRLKVTVAGLLNGEELYSQTVRVNADGPTLFDFDFIGIDTLQFSSRGGHNAGLDGRGHHFAIDDLVYNETAEVPEPATLGLLTAGGLGLFAGRRRRRNAA